MKILIYTLMLIALWCCYNVGDLNEETQIPASWGKYAIDPVVNEVLLKEKFPDAKHSECGLADDDFIKYARKKIDYRREFQFIVFIPGKPLVGERCLRRALIFYLK